MGWTMFITLAISWCQHIRHQQELLPVELLAVLVPLDAVDGVDAGVLALQLSAPPMDPVEGQLDGPHLHGAVVGHVVQTCSRNMRTMEK